MLLILVKKTKQKVTTMNYEIKHTWYCIHLIAVFRADRFNKGDHGLLEKRDKANNVFEFKVWNKYCLKKNQLVLITVIYKENACGFRV